MKIHFPCKFTAPLFALALMATTGSSHAQQGGVAVLDIDKVAQTLGIEENVKESLKEIETGLNAELQKIQLELQTQFNNVRAQVGPQPTQEQAQQLANINGQLTQRLNQSRTQAQSQLNAKQFELVTEFREKVKPVALEIAKAKGLHVIVTPDASLFAYDESIDITEAVTQKIKTDMPELLNKTTPAAAEPAASEGAAAPAAAPTAPAATPVTTPAEQ